MHGQGRGLPHIEFEVRQDLIGTRDGAEEWAETLAAVLDRVHAELSPLAIEHRVAARQRGSGSQGLIPRRSSARYAPFGARSAGAGACGPRKAEGPGRGGGARATPAAARS